MSVIALAIGSLISASDQGTHTSADVPRLRAMYLQNQSAFAVVRAEFVNKMAVPDEYIADYRAVLARIQAQWDAMSEAERADPAHREAYEGALRDARERSFKPEDASPHVVLGRYELLLTPQGVQLKRYHIPDYNPRVRDAMERGLQSVTGGPYDVWRYRDAQWIYRAAYPLVGGTRPVAVRQADRLRLDDFFPALLGGTDRSFVSRETLLSRLWERADAELGYWGSLDRAGEELRLISWEEEARYPRVVVAALRPDKGAFPLWIARWEFRDRPVLNRELLVEILERVADLHDAPTQKGWETAWPLTIEFYDSPVAVQDGGWFVRRFEHREYQTLRALPGSRYEGDRFYVGCKRLTIVEVDDIAANFGVSAAEFETALEEGVLLLDKELGRSGVVDYSAEDMIREIVEDESLQRVGRSRVDWTRTFLLLVNVLLIALVLAFLVAHWLRQRKQGRGES